MAKNFAIWSLPPVTIVHGVPHAEFTESIDVRGTEMINAIYAIDATKQRKLDNHNMSTTMQDR
jgi:hypothetical protein